jgi:iron complex transport system ATP-binding protein
MPARAPRDEPFCCPVIWSIENATFRHEGASRPSISELSLDIARGRITAMLGPNGAGKSTLLHLMLGTLWPRSGRVRLHGRLLPAWTRKELALEIGVVPQGETEAQFTVRQVVAMGRYPYLGPWQRERAEDAAAIARAMDRCDVSAFSGRWLSTLSGGERQRVRLARALAQEPRILVLDEPTASLDIRHEMTMFTLLRSLRDEGTTIVLATHNLNLAARYADEIVMLHGGRLVARGAPSDVLTAARTSEIYEWPIEIVTHASGAPQIDPCDPVSA